MIEMTQEVRETSTTSRLLGVSSWCMKCLWSYLNKERLLLSFEIYSYFHNQDACERKSRRIYMERTADEVKVKCG